MATRYDSAQERQLLLMENMNKRLDAILESQKKLEQSNAVLKEDNDKLKNQLAHAKLDGTRRKTSKRPSSRSDSNVDIPNDLRVSILFFHIVVRKNPFRYSLKFHWR